MRFEKKYRESVTYDLDGKEVKVVNDAEIVMSVEEAKALWEIMSLHTLENETVQDFYDVIMQASEFIEEGKK